MGEASDRDRDDRIATRMDDLRAQREVPYLIPLGGSTPLGAAAYAAAVPELVGQLSGKPVTHLVIAAGSLGSMAGLILGTWTSGLDCQVHGYTVLWPEAEAMTRLQELLEAARGQSFPAVAARSNYRILGSQHGAGYGGPTAAGLEAARLAARHDGLLLDHTYTAKAMAGLIQGIRKGSYTPPRPGHLLPHRGTGRILRLPPPRRLIAPQRGNRGTNNTQADIYRGNDH